MLDRLPSGTLYFMKGIDCKIYCYLHRLLGQVTLILADMRATCLCSDSTLSEIGGSFLTLTVQYTNLMKRV